KELTAVSERLLAGAAVAKERDRGTAKGVAFESIVGTMLEWAFEPYRDVVEETGATLGATGNKCGDHVIYLNPEATCARDLRIVVEAKCRRLGIQAGLAEIERAMKNREAE